MKILKHTKNLALKSTIKFFFLSLIIERIYAYYQMGPLIVKNPDIWLFSPIIFIQAITNTCSFYS